MDQLAAEAGHDLDRPVEQLRAWSAAHLPSGPVVRNAKELRRLMAAEERERAGSRRRRFDFRRRVQAWRASPQQIQLAAATPKA
jgi:hypothetical protein